MSTLKLSSIYKDLEKVGVYLSFVNDYEVNNIRLRPKYIKADFTNIINRKTINNYVIHFSWLATGKTQLTEHDILYIRILWKEACIK
jgi:hypothetical protein